MAKAKLSVAGMTCMHCVQTVKRALEDMEGVEQARVDLRAGTAEVDYDDARTNPGAMAEAVSEEGYPTLPA